MLLFVCLFALVLFFFCFCFFFAVVDDADVVVGGLFVLGFLLLG